MGNVEPILHPLGHGITIIDLMELGVQGRTGCYVVNAEKIAIVETGSSYGAPHILSGLKRLGIRPEQVEYIIVTHIHLDHSGGVGYILPHFPNATVVVHPRGAKHLIDPSRLISGARAVYGDALEQAFGQILPVPEDRVLIRDEGDTLDLGGGRILTFYDTPGHARHHFSIYDPVSEGIFTGDTVGIRYVKQFTGYDFEPIYPSTSPSEFDRAATFESLAKLETLNPKRIYHSHFGMTEPASIAFKRTRETVAAIDDLARANYVPGMEWTQLAEILKDYIREDIEKQGYRVDNFEGFALDLMLNSKGLLCVLE
ncbi:MBL fold metallo-hydrolase [Effusibacillus lacus]|uniref:MBL fold metallo-hydrolase n=1 Tax=Effusibacillus lacus TaxID=1348429 RepID=A0A292YJM4_9BACL|nr:MBL fold metallo-hydrolase [Effusibacillus lacus]TCS74773.1 metallo-beta-lactamase superfamily protein [Effusibacillus lacus]GAX88584.1 MBL fold metallo-hydrolase [Effusibacillus lacus]